MLKMGAGLAIAFSLLSLIMCIINVQFHVCPKNYRSVAWSVFFIILNSIAITLNVITILMN